VADEAIFRFFAQQLNVRFHDPLRLRRTGAVDGGLVENRRGKKFFEAKGELRQISWSNFCATLTGKVFCLFKINGGGVTQDVFE